MSHPGSVGQEEVKITTFLTNLQQIAFEQAKSGPRSLNCPSLAGLLLLLQRTQCSNGTKPTTARWGQPNEDALVNR